METQSDFKELLALLNANHVDYIIVGGYALAYYGLPRFTGDLDLLVKPDTDNARGILNALSEFGFSSLGLTLECVVHLLSDGSPTKFAPFDFSVAR
jgi:hypothetical protein